MRLNLSNGSFFLAREYAQAIIAAGGVPFHIGLIPDRQYLREVISSIDGLLLPGGGDIDPLLYGEDPRQGIGTVIPERDRTDFILLEEAEKLAIPVLGICYGMQMLNVFRGGTLYQDISREVPGALEHEQNEPRRRPSHRIFIEQESLLNRLAEGKETAVVNTHHHQAVRRIGRDLRSTAKTSDGIVEALEDVREDKFYVGVEWHPELNYEDDAFALSLFKSLVKASSLYRRLKSL